MRDPNIYPPSRPEHLLVEGLNDLISGNRIDPDKLREWMLKRWDRISTLAHAIHDAKPKEKTTREKVEDWRTVDQLRAALAAVHDKVEKLERRMYGGGFY